MASPVVTRFAPSPTGFLHIGGARTALFNWLYARACGGKMLLRIEDTDRERSSKEAVDAILDGLSWLGLEWDGDPISQFSRVDRHREVANELLARGMAYKCYSTPEELEIMREKARAEKRPPRYDGTWRERCDGDAPTGVPFVVRIKAPLDGETIVDDKVQGRVRFPNKDLDDFVLLRSDGTPTYMLAVVVDDHDMGITHIIRGDDHLTNGARQTLIYDAMDWEVPSMAHIPLIHGSDGAKLSKRHGAIGAEAYRAMGYLPQALRNYLVRLGWAHGDDEIMTLDQMTQWFGFEGMNKAAARFDFAKLEALNGHYIRNGENHEIFDYLVSVLPEIEGGEVILKRLDETASTQLLTAMPGLKERAKTLVDLVEGATFIFAERPLRMEEKAQKLLDQTGLDHLKAGVEMLCDLDPWDAQGIEKVVRTLAEQRGAKLGQVAQPMRAALTGRAVSPGVFDVLAVLGKAESIARLRDQLKA